MSLLLPNFHRHTRQQVFTHMASLQLPNRTWKPIQRMEHLHVRLSSRTIIKLQTNRLPPRPVLKLLQTC